MAINFYGYLFLRRVAFAWSDCTHELEFILKSEFRCSSEIMMSDN